MCGALSFCSFPVSSPNVVVMFESELTINFDTKEYGGYKLLELPPELCKLVENADTCPQRSLFPTGLPAETSSEAQPGS
jgi:hypothetical protein